MKLLKNLLLLFTWKNYTNLFTYLQDIDGHHQRITMWTPPRSQKRYFHHVVIGKDIKSPREHIQNCSAQENHGEHTIQRHLAFVVFALLQGNACEFLSLLQYCIQVQTAAQQIYYIAEIPPKFPRLRTPCCCPALGKIIAMLLI